MPTSNYKTGSFSILVRRLVPASPGRLTQIVEAHDQYVRPGRRLGHAGCLSRPRHPGATMAAMITISPVRQFVMGSIIVNRTRLLTVAAALVVALPVSMAGQQPPPPGKAGGVFPATQPDDTEGFVSIFDGKTLTGWDGDTTVWRVENGEIVGETTPEKRLKANTFLIWRGEHGARLRAQARVPVERHEQRHPVPQPGTAVDR